MNEKIYAGYRVFLKDEFGKAYECFMDKQKVEVDVSWLLDHMWNNQKYQFKGLIIPFEQIEYIRKSINNPSFVRVIKTELIEFYRDHGLITENELMEFKKQKQEISVAL